MYSNNIVNFQESTTILNAYTKMSRNLLKAPHNCVQKTIKKQLQKCKYKCTMNVIS